MQYEYVFVKELKVGETKQTKKTYPVVVSQSGEIWRLFNNEHVELNRPYTFGYEKSEDGQYKNIKEVIPLQNVWKQEALKELSSKSDITRNVSITITQAIQVYEQKGSGYTMNDLFSIADQIYTYVTEKTDKEYDKINNLPSPKDIK